VPANLAEEEPVEIPGRIGPQAEASPNHGSAAPIVILIPVYDDWQASGMVIEHLDRVLSQAGREAALLLVDDGSTLPHTALRITSPLHAIRSIEVLKLRRNLGHQRAICIGLSYLDREYDCEAVVVMDGDGEDDPGDVPRLLERWEAEGGQTIVFAERTRRSEGLGFRTAYACYKALHRVLTGRGVRVGNFSVLPRQRLRSLVVVAELWSHYAAAVFISRLPFTMLPTRRAERLAGRSAMSFVALVTHGLGAISVFSEVVSVRVLLAALYVGVLTLAGIFTVAGIRLFTPWAIPGWATYTTGLLVIVLLLVVMFAFLFSFTVLFYRKGAAMLPARDYAFFIDDVHRLGSGAGVVLGTGGEANAVV
jgi:polyisoprenyl-phosphate glycosyltransferase